jgi:hypothetical protein
VVQALRKSTIDTQRTWTRRADDGGVGERKKKEEHPVTSAYRLKYVCAHCGAAGAGLDFEADPVEGDSGYYKCRRCHLYVDPENLLGIGVRIDRPACAN